MKLAKANLCSLKGVFLIIICFQSCTEVLYLSLLGEFRGTVTPVVIEMIKLVQGKDVILFILGTVWTEYVFIIILQYQPKKCFAIFRIRIIQRHPNSHI